MESSVHEKLLNKHECTTRNEWKRRKRFTQCQGHAKMHEAEKSLNLQEPVGFARLSQKTSQNTRNANISNMKRTFKQNLYHIDTHHAVLPSNAIVSILPWRSMRSTWRSGPYRAVTLTERINSRSEYR